jgi:putative hydrolase of the HAD superfamily
MESSNSTIAAVLLDIGNVMIHFDYLRAAKRYVEATGLDLPTIEKHFYFSACERQYSRGEISTQAFFQNLSKDLDLKLDFETFARIWNDIFWANDEVGEIVRSLKGRYRLGSISNTNDLHFRYWMESFPVLGLIDDFFPSHRVGARKPEAAIFQAALAGMKLAGPQTVFIDDMEENVRAAEAVGMHGITYRSPESLKDFLIELRIEPWKDCTR